MNDNYMNAAKTFAMIQLNCPGLWKLLTGRDKAFHERYATTLDAIAEIDDMYGVDIRVAAKQLLHTGECVLGKYELRVKASNMVRKAIAKYGVELAPWMLMETHHLPKIVAESHVIAIEKGYGDYSEVILIKTSTGMQRVCILNKKVDRRFRVLFFPNKIAVSSHLADIAYQCGAIRATLIEDSEKRVFVAVDDPTVSICDIKGMYAAEWSRPWIEAVLHGSTKYTPLSRRCGYYHTFKRVAKNALVWYMKDDRSFTAVKRAVRGVKVGGKEIESAEVIRRLIAYVRTYSIPYDERN